MNIIDSLNYINKSIKSGLATAVSALTKHTYNVKLTGSDQVVNKTEINFPHIEKTLDKMTGESKTAFGKLINQLNETRTLLRLNGIKVNNFPETSKFLEFPKSISIDNLPEEKELDFSSLEKKIDELNQSIKKLPTKFLEMKEITFPEFPRVKDVVFPKSFTVENIENLKSEDPESYIPVRLTDGKEFYKAIEEFYQTVTSNITFALQNGQKSFALVDTDKHMQVDVLTMPSTNGSQVTKIKETAPTDSTKTNASLTISNADMVEATTEVLTKTIGLTSYTKTLSINAGGDTIAVSAWIEV